MTICYPIENKLYINLTNRCNNNCSFCIRTHANGVSGYNLFLEREPTSDDVVEDLKRSPLADYAEIVFCGLGEPTLALDILLATADWIKSNTALPIRLNTNGLANLYYGKDITFLLEHRIDAVSVSLNAKNAAEYSALCSPDYGDAAFAGLLEFVRLCKRHVTQVTLTVVDLLPADDVRACREIADSLGVPLRIRSMI